jgi:hypothetical protein
MKFHHNKFFKDKILKVDYFNMFTQIWLIIISIVFYKKMRLMYQYCY